MTLISISHQQNQILVLLFLFMHSFNEKDLTQRIKDLQHKVLSRIKAFYQRNIKKNSDGVSISDTVNMGMRTATSKQDHLFFPWTLCPVEDVPTLSADGTWQQAPGSFLQNQLVGVNQSRKQEMASCLHTTHIPSCWRRKSVLYAMGIIVRS